MEVMISDADILRRFKTDRKQGIQVLFRRYYRPLVLFADEFVHSLSTAEDIVQDFLSGCGQTTIWKNYFLRHFLLIFLLLSGMLVTRMNIVRMYGIGAEIYLPRQILQ